MSLSEPEAGPDVARSTPTARARHSGGSDDGRDLEQTRLLNDDEAPPPLEADRRHLLSLAGRALVGGAVGSLLAAPATADTSVDVQILQTASSLEALAVGAYDIVLGEGPEGPDAPAARALDGIAEKTARDALTAFVRETRRQHRDHKHAFQAQTRALDPGARVQDAPNPKFLPLLAGADVRTPEGVVRLATLLEKVATDSYLLDLPMIQDPRTRGLVAGVMAVEAQHLALLETLGALLEGGTPGLVAIPFPASDLMDLPSATGRVAFHGALHRPGGPDLVAEPASGAVR